MDVLVFLCARGGEVVSVEDLLRACWRGTFYGDNPVHKAVAQLRRALDDSAVAPRYIATVRKRGYRVVAPVVRPEELPAAPLRWSGDSPYVGLVPFDAGHAGVFFGREQVSERILRRLVGQRTHGRGWVLLLGASGCGKTSLLRAGLMPALLRTGGFDGCEAAAAAEFESADASADPLDDLVEAMLAWTIAAEPVFHPGEREHLAMLIRRAPADVAALIDERLRRRLGERSQAALLLVFDRLERLLSRDGAGPPLQRLFDALRALLAGGRVIALAACRNDFYPQLLAVPGMDDLKQGASIDLLPLGAGELVQSIREPARAAGLRFEVDPESLMRLDDVLRDAAVRSPQSLPLLQHALLEIHRRCGDGGVLTFAAYREIGGLDGALAQHAEAVYAALPLAARGCLPSVLGELVAYASDGDSLVGRQALWPEPDAPAQTLVRAFVEQRLFVSELVAGNRTYGVAHEALFRAWPRAAAWVSENRRLLLARARLRRAAARWYQEGRSADFLLPAGSQLDDAAGLLAAWPRMLARRDVMFIEASRKRWRRQRTLRIALIAGIVVSGAAAGVGGVFARFARDDADRRRVQAETLVGFMLGELTDKLQAVGRLDVLDSTANEAMRYLSSQTQADEPSVALLRVRAFQRIGQIRYARGQNEEAGTAFAQALALSERLAAQSDDVDALFEVGNSAFWRGQVAYRAMRLDEARADWTRYLEAARRVVALQPELPRGRLELSYALNNLATLDYRSGASESARMLFQESLRLKQGILARTPEDSRLVGDIANTLSWLGTTASSVGDVINARARQAEALGMLRSARVLNVDDAQLRYRESIAAMQMARADLAVGELTIAAQNADAALETLRSMAAADTHNSARQRDAAFASLQAGWLRVLSGSSVEGCRLISEGVRMAESIGEQEKSPAEWARLLVAARTHQARCALNDGDVASARGQLDKARGKWLEFTAAAVSDLPSAAILTQYAIVDGLVAEREHASDRAIEAAKKALSVARGPPSGVNEPILMDMRARALILVGQLDEAKQIFQKLWAEGYRDPDFIDFWGQQQSAGDLNGKH